MRRLVFFCLVLFAFVPHANAAELPQSSRIIVKFREQTPEIRRAMLLSKISAKRLALLRIPHTISFETSPGKELSTLQSLQVNPDVEYAEPDFIADKLLIPNDPQFANQWGLAKISAEFAWNTQQGSGSVDIAILDSGIELSHPDISQNVAQRVNFTTSGIQDVDGHGTHVAGIAGAVTNNALGVSGVMINSRLLSVKVLADNGSGYYSWIINGITWAADNGAEVINLSLGGSSSSLALQDAVNYAWNKGAIIVAAAGNSGNTRALYPAYYSQVIAVGATTASDVKASYSNYGSWVDVAAPGSSILSTYHGGYAYLTGTSMATPFVSGVAALIKSQHPQWSNAAIRNKLEASTDTISGTGTYWQYGRVNACRAVDCTTIAPTPTPTTFNTPTPIPSTTPTPTPIQTPTPTQTLIITPTSTPTPTPSNKPWFCIYVPTHKYCQ